MKVLFFPLYIGTPHYETELELMYEHLRKRNEVYVLHCKGELRTCFLNPFHKRYICMRCISRFKNGISLIKNNKLKILSIPFGFRTEVNIPENFDSINELKKIKIGFAEVGIGTASSLTMNIKKEHLIDVVNNKDIVKKELSNSYYVYTFIKQMLKEIEPDLVYIFNGRFSTTLPVVNVCEELAITYYTHERGGSINKYLLRKNNLPHDLEENQNEIETLFKRTKHEVVLIEGTKFFINRRKKIIDSWYSYTNEQKENLLPNNFDKSKKNIGIFNSTIQEYIAVRGWECPLNFYKDEAEAFEMIFDSLKEERDIHIYLRVHPNLKNTDNSQMLYIKTLIGKYDNVSVILPESPVDTYALMEQCDTIVTFMSTIGVEACYWGKPSILLGRAVYEKLDCCYIPSNHEDVVKLIKADLAPKPNNGAIKYGFWCLNRGIDLKYFQQTGITTGHFLGQKVRISFITYIQSLWFKLFAI